MPVEYIPIAEPKQTIEKEIKERPKIGDLTTIESPGRPISAAEVEEFEQEEPQKKKKSRKPRTTKVQIGEPDRDTTLIITEKPQAALKIASALGNARKYSEHGVPFYELTRDNKKIIVASAVGHLFNLTYEQGQKGWPIFKIIWEPSFTRTPYTRNYYNLLKKLERKANEIIIATDYDVEGEVIGWNVLRFIMKKNTAKRMKYSTLTKPELIKSYENPLPTPDWGQAYAGETRHQIDWLYGINLSRALMSAIKTSGSFKILSIGRVQGPALKIIVDKDREIESFKSVPYWQIFATAKDVRFKHVKDIFQESELAQFKNLTSGSVTTEKKEENIPPLHPFDLTTLQRESYRLFGISPSETLKIAQSLYLEGIISYPRTSSQKIPKEIEPKKILDNLRKNFPELTKYAVRSEPVEGTKTDPAHPSIYPTGEFAGLEDREKKIYDLIVRRFISAFAEDGKTATKKLELISEEKKFTAHGTKIIDKGWMNVYPVEIEEKHLPDMSGNVKIDKIEFEEKETQPPHRYTPASLITLLEKKNLGTKATRSAIIETLFDRGYVDGKSITATPLGKKLIESLEKYSPIIIDENLTKDLEDKMEEIQESKSSWKEKEDAIIKNVERLITDISRDFKAHELEIGQSLFEGTKELRAQEKEQSIIMPCPQCNVGQLVIKFSPKSRKYFAACDKYPECKAVYSLPPNSLIKRTGKVSPNNLPILVAIRKGKRPWEFEFNPNWKDAQKTQA